MIDLNVYTAEQLGEKKIFCEFCGAELVWHRLNLWGKELHQPRYACDCVEKEDIKRERLKLIEQREENEKRFYRYSNLPKKVCTFDSWQHNSYTQPTRECFDTVQDFLQNYHSGSKGMLIYGEAGCGKTHLSVALANELAHLGVRVIFKNVPTLFEEIFDTFNNYEVKTSDVINPIINSDVVILDDLGAEKPSDFVRSKLYYIINNLYNNNATLIVTSNVDNISDLKDIIGFRSYDRIIEMCNFVHNQGQSYRRYQATNRLNGLSC